MNFVCLICHRYGDNFLTNFKIRKIKSIFWYTHKGPMIFKKNIFTESINLFQQNYYSIKKFIPYKNFSIKSKLHVIGHAIKFDEFLEK